MRSSFYLSPALQLRVQAESVLGLGQGEFYIPPTTLTGITVPGTNIPLNVGPDVGPDLGTGSLFGDGVNTITLLDGTIVNRSDVTFNSSNYTFSWNNSQSGQAQDITDNISRVDQRTFPGFDEATANDWVYRRTYAATHGGQDPGPPLNTSTTSLFLNNLRTSVVPDVASTVKNIAWIAVGGLVLFALLSKK